MHTHITIESSIAGHFARVPTLSLIGHPIIFCLFQTELGFVNNFPHVCTHAQIHAPYTPRDPVWFWVVSFDILPKKPLGFVCVEEIKHRLILINEYHSATTFKPRQHRSFGNTKPFLNTIFFFTTTQILEKRVKWVPFGKKKKCQSAEIETLALPTLIVLLVVGLERWKTFSACFYLRTSTLSDCPMT